MDHTSAAGTPGRKARRDWLAFDRSDRWGLGILLGLVFVAAAVVDVVLPLLRWAGSEGIPVPFVSEVTVPELDDAGTTYGVAQYDVTLADPTTGQRLLDLVPGLMTVGLIAAGCWLIIAVMGTIASGDPFVAANVRRLRRLAALLLIGPIVVFFVDLPVNGALLSSVDLGGLDPATFLEPAWPAFVAGMVVALLAEAFKAGSRLRDDVDGLV